MDDKRQAWANFVEAGPGIRFRWPFMPPSLMFSVNVMRGAYTIPQYGGANPTSSMSAPDSGMHYTLVE